MATILYWYYAIASDNHIYLLISIFIAPLLLIRSDESVALGLRLLDRYCLRNHEVLLSDTPILIAAIFFASIITVGFCNYWLSANYLINFKGWVLDFLLIAVGMIDVWIGFSLVVLISGGGITIDALMAAVIGTCIGSATLISADIGMWFKMLGGFVLASILTLIVGTSQVEVMLINFKKAISEYPFIIFGVCIIIATGSCIGAGIAAGEHAFVYASLGSILSFVSIIFFIIVINIGLGFGYIFSIWIPSLLIRIGATWRHPIKGVVNLSTNWNRTVWCTDLFQIPDFIPGISRSHALHFSNFTKFSYNDGIFEVPFILLTSIIFYAPAMIYRWSLKSTFWFYWPLVFLYKKPNTALTSGLQSPQQIVNDLAVGIKEKFRRFLGLCILISFFIGSFNFFELHALHSQHAIVTLLKLYIVFDWHSLASWHWLNLFNIIITIKIWFMADQMNRFMDRNPILPLDMLLEKKFNTLFMFALIRNLYTILGLIFGFGFVLLYWNNITPNQIASWPGLSFLNVFYPSHLLQEHPPLVIWKGL
ncbi:MAG: hypothetical protein HQL91_08445 [Magnetococcales bacterium]|nr:hypothetical protein [Magnetococcales bacterium]